MNLDKFVNNMEDFLVEFEELCAEHQDKHGKVDMTESDWLDAFVEFVNNGDVELP